jgi:hypothetical protein
VAFENIKVLSPFSSILLINYIETRRLRLFSSISTQFYE